MHDPGLRPSAFVDLIDRLQAWTVWDETGCGPQLMSEAADAIARLEAELIASARLAEQAVAHAAAIAAERDALVAERAVARKLAAEAGDAP